MATSARRSTRSREAPSSKAASEGTLPAKPQASSRLQTTPNKPTPAVGANTNKNGRPSKNANTNTNANSPLRIDAASQRPPRERKQRTTYSPTESAVPTRAYRRRVTETEDNESPDEQCRRLEGRIRSQVKQLRYLQTFLEAYEAEGWRRASREKLKPSKELDVARRKMVKTKRRVVDTLLEIQTLKQGDPQIPFLKEMEEQPSEDEEGDGVVGEREKYEEETQIYCSRCSQTDTIEGNDILLCDSEGCFRAFHQQCQVPAVSTADIPPGDEPWFCASCLALFNALKLINYACETTYEKVDDVFTELAEEEQSLLGGDLGESTAEGTAEEQGDESDGDDEDDDDFSMDENVRKDCSSSEGSESESDVDSGGTSADEGILESDVSEDELKYLHKDDVIDPNRRSTRSKSKASGESWLGRRVAKQSDSNAVVMGVIVEQHKQSDQAQPLWRVVYYDDTMELLDDEAAATAMELAAGQESKADPRSPDKGEDVDRSLIVRGKRKRTRVDYRALNDLLFDGKDDSDVGDDHSHDGEDDDDADEHEADGQDTEERDDEDYTPTTAVSGGEEGTGKRGRRARQKIDYRAMHEGVVSF